MSESLNMLTEDELRTLADDMEEQKILTNDMLGEDWETTVAVFMPLAYGLLEEVQAEQIGIIYQYFDKAIGNVGKHPLFDSCCLLHVSQVDTLIQYCEEFKATGYRPAPALTADQKRIQVLKRALMEACNTISEQNDKLEIENFGPVSEYSVYLAVAASEFGYAQKGDSAFDLYSIQ